VIHLDTSFLVDLLRERRKSERPATEALGRWEDAELRVSVHAMCELYAGVELSDRSGDEREAVEALTRGFEIVSPGPGFAPTYGRIFSHLQGSGTLISAMDLLIGTAAAVDSAPILTANPRHFRRIPGLDVITY